LVLADADGKEIRLGSLRESKPAVIVLLRHYGRIFCREHHVVRLHALWR
jgi:hypothetical protein